MSPTIDTDPIFIEATISWKRVMLRGVFNGILTLVLILIFLLFLNLLSFGSFLLIFREILLLVSIGYLFSGGLIIWFGPSPQWALIKSTLVNRRIKPKTSTESLEIGIRRVFSGLVLLLITL